MSLPASARHRWGVEDGGEIGVIDLDGALLLVPGGIAAAKKALRAAIAEGRYEQALRSIEDSDLSNWPAALKSILLDDRLLLDHLLDGGSIGLRALCRRRTVATTGLWYYRLCHAIRSDIVVGALSGPFLSAPIDVRAQAGAALVRLPEHVELVSLRDLAPTMAELVDRHRLNVLSLEALAAALNLGADLALAEGSENPTLIEAAESERVRVHIIAPG
jgi:hypothetical protein